MEGVNEWISSHAVSLLVSPSLGHCKRFFFIYTSKQTTGRCGTCWPYGCKYCALYSVYWLLLKKKNKIKELVTPAGLQGEDGAAPGPEPSWGWIWALSMVSDTRTHWRRIWDYRRLPLTSIHFRRSGKSQKDSNSSDFPWIIAVFPH